MEMSLFVNEKNLARYRLLASSAITEADRRALFDALGRQYTIASNISQLRLLDDGSATESERAYLRARLTSEEAKYAEFEATEGERFASKLKEPRE